MLRRTKRGALRTAFNRRLKTPHLQVVKLDNLGGVNLGMFGLLAIIINQLVR